MIKLENTKLQEIIFPGDGVAAKYNGLWFFAIFGGGKNEYGLVHKNIVVTPEAIAGLPKEVIAFGNTIGFAVHFDRANLNKVCAENAAFEDSIRNGWQCLNDEFSVYLEKPY